MCKRILATATLSMIVLGKSASPALAADPPDTILSHHHASTPAESFLRGMADAMRSLGDAAKRFSEAMINTQRARTFEIENHELEVQKWFDLKTLNIEWHRLLRGPQRTAKDYVRLAAMDKPRMLSTSELDPVTGELAWPILLRTQEYAAERQILDRIFACLVIGGKLSWDELVCIGQTTDVMLEKLKGQIYSLPQMEYIDAMRFIQRLAFGARQQAKQVKGFALANAAGQ